MEHPHRVYINLNKDYVKSNKLNIIMGMPHCESCQEAHSIFENHNMKVDCACWMGNSILKEEMKKEHNHRTFPIIFIEGEFIGGLKQLQNKMTEKQKESSTSMKKDSKTNVKTESKNDMKKEMK